jgi:PBP1b-binding outer membrane lipoprotein LpoB
MSTTKRRIAIVGSAMLLLSGCANQGGGQEHSGTSTSATSSTTSPGNTNLGTPPMLPTSTATGR